MATACTSRQSASAFKQGLEVRNPLSVSSGLPTRQIVHWNVMIGPRCSVPNQAPRFYDPPARGSSVARGGDIRKLIEVEWRRGVTISVVYWYISLRHGQSEYYSMCHRVRTFTSEKMAAVEIADLSLKVGQSSMCSGPIGSGQPSVP